MPAPKRQKLSAATVKNASSSTSKPRGLDAFTRVSKKNAASKAILDKAATSSPKVKAIESGGGGGGARKRRQVDEDTTPRPASDNASVKQRDLRPLPITRRSNLSQRAPETPKKLVSLPISAHSEESPSKEACSLFSRFGLVKSSPTQFDSSPLCKEEDSILDGFEDIRSSQIFVDRGFPNEEEENVPLPAELLDLINLHASFLNALSLHYAHNGTHTPADLRELCPAIALSWGKRSVTLQDIRQALGVQNHKDFNNSLPSLQSARSSTLTLSNYGENKICIETSSVFGKKGAMARPLDEQHLNNQYTSNLTSLWNNHCRSLTDMDPGPKSATITTFIINLPLQPITACVSLEKISPSLAKGQRRLQDLKASLTQKKEAAAAKKTTTPDQLAHESPNTISNPPTPGKQSTLTRSTSLLSRILAKQAHASTLPAPPSPASQSRTAALHRLEEVISIITLLSSTSGSGSTGQSRVSFSFGTVVGRLRDSMRNPISEEEGRRCLEVLAGEVAPEWLRMVGGGGGKGSGKGKGILVVDRERRVEGEEVRRRIEKALVESGGAI